MKVNVRSLKSVDELKAAIAKLDANTPGKKFATLCGVNLELADGIRVDAGAIRCNGRFAFLASPQRPWEDKNGVTQYAPIVTIPRHLADSIVRQILASVDGLGAVAGSVGGSPQGGSGLSFEL